MNRYARSIISEFLSDENKDYLKDNLLRFFNNDPNVKMFLSQNFDDFVNNFCASMTQELSLSDPLPGSSIYDQLSCFNNQFLEDRVNFIKAHVRGEDEIPMYMIKDDIPTTRYGLSHYQKNSDYILNSWRDNSGRGVQAREDPSNDVYPNNTYYGDSMSTGIMFCDQSNIGMQRHHDLFFGGLYMQALNKTTPCREYENTPFGVSTPSADARLLSRSVFRKNEAGVENGISRREARLNNRYLERNINEGLRNGEHGYKLSGYDMTSLYERIDYKNQIQAKYGGVQSRLHLQNNNAKVPDDMRYC